MVIDKGIIISSTVTNIIEDASTDLWKKVKKFFKDFDNQKEIDLGFAYERYIRQN